MAGSTTATAVDMLEIEKECFKKGAQVEVCLDEAGFRGSWYTASIVRTFTAKSRKVFVEFHHLKSDARCTKPLRQSVNVVLLRPLPPQDPPGMKFKFSDEVDAFHDDGWWEGVITALHDDGRFSVYFRPSKEQIEFSPSQLRLHREWVHGKWVPPAEEEGGDGVPPVEEGGGGGDGEAEKLPNSSVVDNP